MPSSIIQNYFNDSSPSAPSYDARTKAFNDLHNGVVDEPTLEQAITQKYGDKYGNAAVTKTQPDQSLPKADPTQLKSPMVQSFLNDPKANQQDKDNLLIDLGSGGHDETSAENAITRQFGDRYGKATPVQPPTPSDVPAPLQGAVNALVHNPVSDAVNAVGKGATDMVDQSAQGIAAGADTIAQGGGTAGLGGAISGIDENGKQLDPAERAIRAGKGLLSIPTGALQAAGGAVAPVINKVIPYGKELTGAIGGGIHALSQVGSGGFKEALGAIGVHLSPEQEDAVNNGFDQLGNLLTIKHGEDAAGFKALEKAKSTALKTGDIAKYEQLAAVKPTMGQNFAGNVTKGAEMVTKPLVEPIMKAITNNPIADAIKSRIPKAPPTANELVGKIIRGEEKDQPAALRTLGNIDTTGIKTTADLSKAIQDKTNQIKLAQNEHLSSIPEVKPLKDYTTEIKVGDKSTKVNYVDTALKQLKTYYDKAMDPTNSLKIDNLIDKGNKTGLSLKEVNDISREYGKEFSQKSFKANGEHTSGINGKAAENVRTGIKDTVRNLDPSGKSKVLDAQMSDMINTKKLVDKVTEKTNTLVQTTKARGVGEMIGGAAADALNAVTFGGAKGFIEKLTKRNVGLKTLNHLDVQEMLPKTLEQIQKLQDKVDTAKTPVAKTAAIKQVLHFLNDTGVAQKATKAVIKAAPYTNQTPAP